MKCFQIFMGVTCFSFSLQFSVDNEREVCFVICVANFGSGLTNFLTWFWYIVFLSNTYSDVILFPLDTLYSFFIDFHLQYYQALCLSGFFLFCFGNQFLICIWKCNQYLKSLQSKNIKWNLKKRQIKVIFEILCMTPFFIQESLDSNRLKYTNYLKVLLRLIAKDHNVFFTIF